MTDRSMPLPNLLIVGSQKCGTSWLHRSLGKSKHIFATKVKELNHFNRIDFDDPDQIEAYASHFDRAGSSRYRLETTPHYFRLRKGRVDPACNIRDQLGSPKLLAVFRDPVDRYESAYIHHVMRDRLPYTPEIDSIVTDHGLVSLGRYAQILEHWWNVHPHLEPLLYDDLLSDPMAFVAEIMQSLDLDSDLTRDDLDFRANDKAVKRDKLSLGWTTMPRLTKRARGELREIYRDDVQRLEVLLGRDLGHWLRDDD